MKNAPGDPSAQGPAGETGGNPTKPATALAVVTEGIPSELRERRQWVCWRFEMVEGKPRKVPYDPKGEGRFKAKSNAPTTWSAFEVALEYYRSFGLSGVGFVFTDDDPFVGIDLDLCRNAETGELELWAAKIVRDLDTYTEVSPSGTGVKLFLKAKLARSLKTKHVEVYSSGRYFAYTGHKLDSAPSTCNERHTQLDALLSKLQEGKQSVQRNGQHQHYPSVPNRDRAVALEALQHLAPSRCDEYGGWIEVGQALHAVGTDLLPAWETWSTASPKFRNGECAAKWTGFNANGGLGLGSLLFWAKQDSGWAPQQRRNEPPEQLSESTKTAQEGIKVGNLLFVLDSARRTPAKIIAEIEVRNAVGPIDRLTLTSAAASRKEFVKAVGRLAPDQVDAEELAGKFLAAAAQLAHVRATVEGITVRQIVAEKVPPAFRFAYRTDKGAWSEARGCEVTRAEFIGYTPASLIESCKTAADFQGDGVPDDTTVLRAVDAALKITWPTLLSELPRMESADLPKDSEAAKRFRNAIIHLWSRPFAGESITRESGEQVNLRASLRSRVTSQINKQQRSRPAGWVKVHPAYSAWWREHCDEHGETHIYLAMRYELATEGQVAVPGGDSQVSLLAMGSRCGAIDPAPPVPRKLSKGAARLAVLTRDLTDYLLAEPIEGDEAGDAERPPASPSVTEEGGFRW
jgi:Primase C terminal 2 (PriCT-2)